METVSDVAYCPTCGNSAPQEQEGSFDSRINDAWHNYVLTRCMTCLAGLLYRRVGERRGGTNLLYLGDHDLLWPKPSELHDSVPDAVSRIYAEAALIKGRAPNAFANQIRRCLEAICKDRGATKTVLAQALQELAARGEIPQRLVEMTDVLRKLGNIGSHAGDEEIHPSYVEAIDEFFRAIVEYVYVAPHKVDEFKKRLDAASKIAKP